MYRIDVTIHGERDQTFYYATMAEAHEAFAALCKQYELPWRVVYVGRED